MSVPANIDHPLIDKRHFFQANWKLMTDEEIKKVKKRLVEVRKKYPKININKVRRIYERREDFTHFDPAKPKEGLILRPEYKKIMDQVDPVLRDKAIRDFALENLNKKPTEKALKAMPDKERKEAINE